VEFREIWEQVHYGPEKSSLNFGSDMEHILGSSWLLVVFNTAHL